MIERGTSGSLICPTCINLVQSGELLAYPRGQQGEPVPRAEYLERLENARGLDGVAERRLLAGYELWSCPTSEGLARHPFPDALLMNDTIVISLVGPPGVAKSSFVYQLRQHLDRGFDGWLGRLDPRQVPRWLAAFPDSKRFHVVGTERVEHEDFRQPWLFFLEHTELDQRRLNVLVFDPAGEDDVADQEFLAMSDALVLFVPHKFVAAPDDDAGLDPETVEKLDEDLAFIVDRFAQAINYALVGETSRLSVLLALSKGDMISNEEVQRLVKDVRSRLQLSVLGAITAGGEETMVLTDLLKAGSRSSTILDAFNEASTAFRDDDARRPWLRVTVFSGTGSEEGQSRPQHDPNSRILDPLLMSLYTTGHVWEQEA